MQKDILLSVAAGSFGNTKGWSNPGAAPCFLSFALGDTQPWIYIPGYIDGVSTVGQSGSASCSKTMTFEDLGVPAGSTITGITGASLSSKCIADTHNKGTGVVEAKLSMSGVTVQLSSQRPFAGVDSAYVVSGGVDASGLALPSNTQVTITMSGTLHNATTGHPEIGAWLDELKFSVQY